MAAITQSGLKHISFIYGKLSQASLLPITLTVYSYTTK